MPEPRRWRLELDADFCRTGFGVPSVDLDDSTRRAFTAERVRDDQVLLRRHSLLQE